MTDKTTTERPILDEALEYARTGLPVFLASARIRRRSSAAASRRQQPTRSKSASGGNGGRTQ
jgi:hypothetical protein